jgi:hypothetical protein
MDDNIPWSAKVPSLTSLRATVKKQCPSFPPELIDAIAIINQCAYEDFLDWCTMEWPRPTIVNPSGFKRANVLGLATAYLKHQDLLINSGD